MWSPDPSVLIQLIPYLKLFHYCKTCRNKESGKFSLLIFQSKNPKLFHFKFATMQSGCISLIPIRVPLVTSLTLPSAGQRWELQLKMNPFDIWGRHTASVIRCHGCKMNYIKQQQVFFFFLEKKIFRFSSKPVEAVLCLKMEWIY